LTWSLHNARRTDVRDATGGGGRRCSSCPAWNRSRKSRR
jgi:hypothetical protein